ncbi:MAG: hypothetical protein KDK04_12755 [Candidatus Competibacteraceae bacterium]|nr:hypothetical protein [Candidatus Competibacteraceae bacterium]
MAIIGMLVLTIAIVLAVSYVASIIWGVLFAAALPGYISGLLGGLAALPAWETLKRLRKKKANNESPEQ